VLRQLPKVSDPNLLVGISTGDDAAVYKLNDDLAIIQTLDFFPPIVDDPFTYGEIAVANSLSDVYAMGGKPLLGLNIVGFPVNLSKDILGEILKGGASKAGEADVIIVGGHTVDDKEPKYGLSVTGVVKPGCQITNAGCKPGDVLVLTKPLGTGIITTAGKQQSVKSDVIREAVRVMNMLNRDASEAMVETGVNACSDITGFGLLGHLRSMIYGSDVGAVINVSTVPVIDGVWDLLDKGIAPGGTRRNLSSVEDITDWHSDVNESTKLLLADAQTSGGLLISVPSVDSTALINALRLRGVETISVVGEVVSKESIEPYRIKVIP